MWLRPYTSVFCNVHALLFQASSWCLHVLVQCGSWCLRVLVLCGSWCLHVLFQGGSWCLYLLQVIEMRHTSRLLLLLLLLLTELLSTTDARTIRAIRPEIVSTRRSMCHSRPARQLREQLGSSFHPTHMSLVDPDQSEPDDVDPNSDGRRLGSTVERIQNGGHIGANTTRHSVLNTTTTLQRLLQRAKEASAAAADSSSTDTADSPSADTSARSLPNSHTHPRPVRSDANYFAENTTSAANSRLPWNCQMESVWKKMAPGIFPPYVQTGRCVQRTCMFGACNCVPKKYVMKILRRVPDVCNPIPSVGVRVHYEDAWAISRIKVTVHCACSRK